MKELPIFFGIRRSLLVIIVLISCNCFGQSKADSLFMDSINRHSPKKASMYSAILPGLGQAYNKKFWKIPIVYAGLATTGYFAVNNHREFKRYKNAYIMRVDGDSSTIDEFAGTFSDGQLLTKTDEFRRSRDFFYILTAGVYLLNIVDAAVDAHFFHFDVSDNLSLRVEPQFQYNGTRADSGLRLTLKF